MTRIVCSAMLVLAMVSQARADDELTGTWRNTLEGLGTSYWELTPKKDGAYDAQEVGMGGRLGTARLKDGVLTIEFKAEDHTGVYEWRLKGPAGQGTYTQTHTDGQVLKLKTSIRYIGK